MAKNDIPDPICMTCGVSGETSCKQGKTFYRCGNCGTEMRYMPAGELLNSGSKKAIENNGWALRFSVKSSELYSGQAMFILGIAIVTLTLIFLWLGKLDSDAALWSAGSGIFLSLIGKRKSIIQKKKTRLILSRYPYWKQ